MNVDNRSTRREISSRANMCQTHRTLIALVKDQVSIDSRSVV
jgi:hypothetical protein